MYKLVMNTLNKTATLASMARRTLQDALTAKQWKSGEKLPTERELSEMLGVNRMSLRQALLSLENEGTIFRIDRKGWYVSQPRFVYDPLGHISFQQAAAEQGSATWKDLKQEVISANTNDAQLFGIAEGSPLLQVQGWGAFNQHRIFVHNVLINLENAPDYPEKLTERSFTQVWIKEYGIKPKLADLMIRPVRLEGEPQHLLGCTNGAPGLYLRRIKTDDHDQVIQVDREFWRFEALELRFSTKQGG